MQSSGTCLCGDIGVRLQGWVSKVQARHAERCRKATGGVFAPEIAASSERFEWVGDTGRIASYEAPVLHRPPAYRRSFCTRCGSPLPVEIDGAGMVVRHAGLLDDSAGFFVFRHAFTAQKAACCGIDDDLPGFAGQPPAPDPADILD